MNQKVVSATADLFHVEQVQEMIQSGQNLLLAGDESALSQLPQGRWIGGSIPYFMAEKGGSCSRDRIFATVLPDSVSGMRVELYDSTNIANVYSDAPENGFSVIIVPASSDVHLDFALKATHFPGFATRPLIGWVSGVLLDDLNRVTPKVFDGQSGRSYEDKAVVLHADLPASKFVELGIINIFEPGDGDTITFPRSGFDAATALVNGEEVNFADYLEKNQIDTKLPLVADLYGAMVNTSFKGVDPDSGKVQFYAPVFEGTEYKVARPMADYVREFEAQIPDEAGNVAFSCNCILNYLYADLEGKRTQGFNGPVTFGEIAYQLLNQTMAYLLIEDA